MLTALFRQKTGNTPGVKNPIDIAPSLTVPVIGFYGGQDQGIPQTDVAKIRLDHDLSQGIGQALIDVPGITFAPKGLQPERLTPVTLGVVANVSGTVSGKGRIDWGAQGVTSSGSFGTERLDLAAAFGPVTGLKGQINFTDLLGLVSAPHQEATVAEINPGVAVTNGVVHYQLTGQSRVRVEDAMWPFAGGTLRLDPSELRLPPERKDWAPLGILAYSKICTHAGCALGLYRKPMFPPVEPSPALVCPCHYSTFDVADGGNVLFGPAGRALPQLPLMIDRRGRLRAGGNFSGPVGPSWWGVRKKPAVSPGDNS